MQEDPLRVGYVSSVNGSKVSGVLVGQEEAKFDDGRLIEAVQIGSLVKVRTARSIAFGIVNGLAVQQPTSPPTPQNLRTLEIDLFGESVDGSVSGGHFAMQRGVSIYPGLGQPIYAATSHDLARIYAPPQAANVQIGTLHQDPNLPACVATDELLGKHLAILGTTGSGKSCAVALILQAVLRASMKALPSSCRAPEPVTPHPTPVFLGLVPRTHGASPRDPPERGACVLAPAERGRIPRWVLGSMAEDDSLDLRPSRALLRWRASGQPPKLMPWASGRSRE